MLEIVKFSIQICLYFTSDPEMNCTAGELGPMESFLPENSDTFTGIDNYNVYLHQDRLAHLRSREKSVKH